MKLKYILIVMFSFWMFGAVHLTSHAQNEQTHKRVLSLQTIAKVPLWTDLQNVRYFKVQEGWGYVVVQTTALSSTQESLYILNLSDPITVASQITLPIASFYQNNCIRIQKQYLAAVGFISNDRYPTPFKLVTYDLSDKTSPRLLVDKPIGDEVSQLCQDIEIVQKSVYVSEGVWFDPIYIHSIFSGTLENTLTVTNSVDNLRLSQDGKYVWGTGTEGTGKWGFWGNVTGIDVTNPISPLTVSYYRSGGLWTWETSIVNDMLFSSGQTGILIHSIAQPPQAKFLKWIDPEKTPFSYIDGKLNQLDNFVFYTTAGGSLAYLNITSIDSVSSGPIITLDTPVHKLDTDAERLYGIDSNGLIVLQPVWGDYNQYLPIVGKFESTKDAH